MTTTHPARAKVTITSDTELVITREFNAPARLVYKASTTPELMKRWYGPTYMTMTKCEMDVRVGGGFAWTLRAPDGSDHSFKGEYLELVPAERMVYTESYLLGDQWTNPLTSTVTYEEKDGKTLLTIRSVYASKEDLQGHVGSGMEEGMAASHERLDVLLEELGQNA